jgi:hypothetical protein
MRFELFLISIILFFIICYFIKHNTIEKFQDSRSGTYTASMFGSNECPPGQLCLQAKFSNDGQYMLYN